MKSNNWQKVAKDIADLKIQGAQNVAVEALKALSTCLSSKTECRKAYKALIEARPTEPAMRNALSYMMKNKDQKDLAKKIIQIFEDGKKKIAEYTAHKIRDGMTIVTYCHSSTVTQALKKAHDEGKKFRIFVCETRPLYQGRKTAKELLEFGLEVEMIVDSNMTFPLNKADLVLIGADSISAEGNVINKVGSRILSLIAEKYDVPLYVCSHSWKVNLDTQQGYDEEIENRHPSEVWDHKHKNLKIYNFAFEKVDSDNVTGIISELGVTAPEQILGQVRKAYPELT